MREQLLSKRTRTNCLLLLLLFSLYITGCGSISDGEYTASVVMKGGSGRAYIESPCVVTVEKGKAVARLVWSSPNYDYMIVDGTTYYPVNTEGNSVFEVPVQLGKEFPVQADTTAMSTPHLIDYTLLLTLGDNGAEADAKDGGEIDTSIEKASMDAPDIPGLTYLSTDENAYARCYRIHRYSDDYAVISIEDGRNYLVVPEGAAVPEGGESFIILQKPLDTIYLAASGAMCHFDRLGAIENIALSGIEKDDWYIDSAKEAMGAGTLVYGGKYSAPDYEQIVMMDIDVAIENSMILHTPKVQEKLEKLGIPVFIDRASYEPEPLGRCEWVKVYGVLTGKENEALSDFSEQVQQVSGLELEEGSGKSVVIFSVNSNHQIVTRRTGDYFAKMVELGGGNYLSPVADGGDETSQMTISVEAFYDYAQNADVLIYNATIEDAPGSLEELQKTDAVFADFKAFKEGNVWYTDKSIYQLSDRTGTIINNLYQVITKGQEETEFFHKLK
jgi:iron complex transport system substrate-binding protein